MTSIAGWFVHWSGDNAGDFILGICGNVLEMIVIIRRKCIANTIHICVVSLCINDIINLGLNNTPVTSSYLLGKWPTGQLGCELSTHFTVMGSSLWHTALIAMYRLVIVVYWWTASIEPTLTFFHAGHASRGLSLFSV